MHPVLPSTMVRGPAALTIIFITRADSHPWQVRWPEVKNSSRGSFLTPLKGSSFCVSSIFTTSASSLSFGTVAISNSSFVRSIQMFLPALLAKPNPLSRRLLLALRRQVHFLGHLLHVGQRHLATSQAADETQQRHALAR